MSPYPYAEGNLLDERNTYFYTKYEGYQFLTHWQEARAAVLAGLPEGSAEQAATVKKIKPLDYFLSMHEGESFRTEDFLDTLDRALSRKGAANDSTLILSVEKLVQRFEVAKRIHGRYNWRFRATDKEDFRNLELYVRAAEIYESAYAAEMGLPCLNVLLKILDTLSSQSESLDIEQKKRLRILIEKEYVHVSLLAGAIGLEI